MSTIASDKDYVFALAEALRQEYLEIYNAGLLLQVDDAVLANMYDHLVQQSPERYREWAQLEWTRSITRCAAFPRTASAITSASEAGMFRIWRTRRSKISSSLIVQVRAGAYSIEAANPRHEHEWRVWQGGRLPKGKILIPGVDHSSHDHGGASAGGRRSHHSLCGELSARKT